MKERAPARRFMITVVIALTDKKENHVNHEAHEEHEE
jgi:hypothetical protein